MVEVHKTISIHKKTDIVFARMRVREVASKLGFGLIAQAHVAMAVYDMLCKMGMGTSCEGKVTINQMKENCREGMQIICTSYEHSEENLSRATFSDACSLVDELSVEKPSPNSECVTVVKWKK